MSIGKQLLTPLGSLPHPSSGSCSQVPGLLDPAFQSSVTGAHKMACLLIEITNGGKTNMQHLLLRQCISEIAMPSFVEQLILH